MNKKQKMCKKSFFILIIVFTLFMTNCITHRSIFRQIPFKISEIDSLIIENQQTKKLIVVKEQGVINIILSDYILTGKRKINVFLSAYKITLFRREEKSVFLINKTYLKYKGISYKMSKSFDEFILENKFFKVKS